MIPCIILSEVRKSHKDADGIADPLMLREMAMDGVKALLQLSLSRPSVLSTEVHHMQSSEALLSTRYGTNMTPTFFKFLHVHNSNIHLPRKRHKGMADCHLRLKGQVCICKT